MSEKTEKAEGIGAGAIRRAEECGARAPKDSSPLKPGGARRRFAGRGAAYTDENGWFGQFGGRYVPETLMPAVKQLAEEYDRARRDGSFRRELGAKLKEYGGRPTPLTFCRRISEDLGVKVFLKREDLNHTGSHKLNNVLGQVLLAVRMGKKRIIAETGAGQHGVATATAAALFGLRCEIYMGSEDARRQALNVFRMELLGAKVHRVDSGQRTLKDACNEALRDWMASVRDTHYVIGSTVGPDPYPRMVRDFQSVIGRETRRQILAAEGRLPDVIIACVGGGSNSMGIFHPFLEDVGVRLIGVEAAGEGLNSGRHAATLARGKVGVLHGMKTYVLQDEDGQTAQVHSVSAGLDYPGVGPEHAFLKDAGRAEYVAVRDREALSAFVYLSRMEGIIPALESAHAVAFLRKLAPNLRRRSVAVINLSGRGDKDCEEAARLLGEA